MSGNSIPDFYQLAEDVIEMWVVDNYPESQFKLWQGEKPSGSPYFFSKKGWRNAATQIESLFNNKIHDPIEVFAYVKISLFSENIQVFQAYMAEVAFEKHHSAKAKGMVS